MRNHVPAVRQTADLVRLSSSNLAERLAKALSGYSAKAVAHLTGSSVRTAKGWKCGQAVPRAAELLALATSIPEVRAFLVEIIAPQQAELDTLRADLDALRRRMEALGR